jgi:hypothetical protein
MRYVGFSSQKTADLKGWNVVWHPEKQIWQHISQKSVIWFKVWQDMRTRVANLTISSLVFSTAGRSLITLQWPWCDKIDAIWSWQQKIRHCTLYVNQGRSDNKWIKLIIYIFLNFNSSHPVVL